MIDIIIPTYNNPQGLRNTLQSIPTQYLDQLVVTVIDDGSSTPYTQVVTDFPFINFTVQENQGPGIARQIGIETTYEPYIMFIDTGDYFLQNVFPTILTTVAAFPTVNIFGWKFRYGENKLSNHTANHLHGRVYKRKFLDDHNIKFCFEKEASYSNEDIGFNYACRLVSQNYPNSFYFDDEPILMYNTNDSNSLTNKNNREFIYNTQNISFAQNAINAYNIAVKNNVPPDVLAVFVANNIQSLYYWYLRTVLDRPQFTQNAFNGALYYYKHLYATLPKPPTASTAAVATRLQSHYQDNTWKTRVTLNINQFVKELERKAKYE